MHRKAPSCFRSKELNAYLIILYAIIGFLFAGCQAEPKVKFQVTLIEESVAPIAEEDAALVVKPQFAECPILSELTDQVVENFATKMWGTESCRFRQVIKADDIEVVLFTLEGSCEGNKAFFPQGGCGNRYERYMGGVAYGRKITSVRVGSRSDFKVESAEIIESDVVISGKTYQDGDSSCCPSKPAQRHFKIGEATFEEVLP